MSVTINFDEKSVTQLDLDGDDKIDRATVVADVSADGKSITGKVYIALAADGFSKDKLIAREFSKGLDFECKDISTQGQKLFFSCGGQTIDAATIVKNEYSNEIVDDLLASLRVTSDLNADLNSGIGGLIGSKGTQIGSGGLVDRSSGLGGGGTADGLGGLGTKGRGTGSSGYGEGGGNFGSKGEGGIGPVGGDPIITGWMDKSLIDAVIKRHMIQFHYAYQRELEKDPELSGKVTIRFVIAHDGSVRKAEVRTDRTRWNHPDAGEAVGKTLCARFLKLQFPVPEGEEGAIVIVSYPFIFSPG